MINLQKITLAEEGLMNFVGIGLLVFLVFYLLSLLQIARYLKSVQKINLFSIFAVGSGVLSLLFIFSDVALINDIGKQYRHGLSQPEWFILYPIMTFQFVTAIVFTYLHFSGLLNKRQLKFVAKDSNIFLVVHCVGSICGLMGLSLSGLGFLFPKAWSLQIHTTISSIVLLIPYFLAVIYWLLVKLQEKPRQWYDEKQLQDVGKSSFLTLLISVGFMTALFIVNYENLYGVISISWLPLYLFSTLLIFSTSNLYFSNKD